MRTAFALAAIGALMVTATTSAQKSTPKPAAATEEFQIVSIDHPDRIVTLLGKQDRLRAVYCSPDVQRCDELKLDDKITFAFDESTVTAIKPAGAPDIKQRPATITRTPAGPLMYTVTAVSTLMAVDANAPSVTVSDPDGSPIVLKVADGRTLQGLKAGDKVDLTHSRTVTITIEPAKAK